MEKHNIQKSPLAFLYIQLIPFSSNALNKHLIANLLSLVHNLSSRYDDMLAVTMV
jgi:hypothetical protein